MKFLIAFTLALLINPVEISRINSLKEKAQEAFEQENYKLVVEKCSYLSDSLNIEDDRIVLNLAHAYLLSNDTAQGFSTYQRLTTSSLEAIRSKAYQQMGVIKNKQGVPEEALAYFKEAINADKKNKDARYNYELLKRYIEYPEIILNRIRLLVKHRKYKEARKFLDEKMQESQRIRQFSDYANRIETIITIDSLGRL